MTLQSTTRGRGIRRGLGADEGRGGGAEESRQGAPASGASRSGRLFAARMHRPGLWFALPATALMAIFFAYPLVVSLLQSFYRTQGGVSTFVGLDQYTRMLRDPLVAKSLFNAGLILIVQVPIMIALAVGLAYLLNQSWLRFRAGFRLIVFLPAITTLVAYSVVFRVIMTTDGGLLNQFLGLLGAAPIDWLNNEWWSRVAVIASITWRWTGYNMVIILAGLQAIAPELYEAARIDGAGRWQTFRHVVVPQLRPVLIFTSVTSTIGALQLFDENYILTGGGPNNATLTPVLYLYKMGFQQFDFGYASAIAWMLVILTGIIAVVQFRIMREKP
ncbi:lactose/L-arabinose transport system permease protein [Microbacterium sp. W4I4]|uniref:carbohydrate ABC transporter permease n=1 Tax=Microbacterium sp. W4I4 TaxID=3042295 RepID=UPI0027834615|nr:sugar ABC transporter permease [Microbacterium sp. W4I4]MDQ0614301.1 lactose/L-arabinose transport system permease protein [Microbacterium sp. W4I4]